MTNKKLNFGIIGIGWWSDVLAERAKKNNLFEITACFSRARLEQIGKGETSQPTSPAN
jgi:predicted dehydrogenase